MIVKPVKSCTSINDFIISTSVKKISTHEQLILELTLNINIDYGSGVYPWHRVCNKFLRSQG